MSLNNLCSIGTINTGSVACGSYPVNAGVIKEKKSIEFPFDMIPARYNRKQTRNSRKPLLRRCMETAWLCKTVPGFVYCTFVEPYCNHGHLEYICPFCN